jgi:hypothetical protein
VTHPTGGQLTDSNIRFGLALFYLVWISFLFSLVWFQFCGLWRSADGFEYQVWFGFLLGLIWYFVWFRLVGLTWLGLMFCVWPKFGLLQFNVNLAS